MEKFLKVALAKTKNIFIKKTLRIFFFSVFLVSFGQNAFAQNFNFGLQSAESFDLPAADIRIFAINIIRSLLSFVGFYLMLRIIYAGFLMMTHGDSEVRRDHAVGELKSSVIGFFIIISSVAITKFVITTIATATGIF